MNIDDILLAARRRLNAVGDTLWSDAELLDYLYFAESRLAEEAFTIEGTDSSTTTAASTADYTVPTDMLAIRQITWNDQKLEPIDFREQDSVNIANSTSADGEPSYYLLHGETITLEPTPNAAQTLKYWSYDLPTRQTSAASSAPDTPTEYHPDLVNGICAFMVSKEPGHPHLSYYTSLWESSVTRVIRMQAKKKRGDKFTRVKREEDLPTTHMDHI